MANTAQQPRVVGVFFILFLLILLPVVSQVNLPFLNPIVQADHYTSYHLPLQTNSLNLDPSLIWNRTYSQSTYDRGYAIVECQEVGYAILGETRQEGLEFRSDVWLLRVDDSGNVLWNTTIGSVDDERGYDLVETPEGGFAFVGVHDRNVFFVQTNLSGFQHWNRTLYAGEVSIGLSIVNCQTGGFAILGMLSYNRTWLVRMNAMNFVLWNQTYDVALHDGGDTLVQCQDGGFAFTGTSSYYNTPDAMLFRTDVDGNLIWNQTYGGQGHYFSRGLVECEDGGFAIAGAKREYGEDDFNIWLVRTDSFGEMIWNFSYGDENETGSAYSVVQTLSGGFALTGFESSFANYFQVVFLVTNPSGVSLIDWRLGGFFAEVGHSIVECQDGGFAIVGDFYDYAFVYRVLLFRIPGPHNPNFVPRDLWLDLVLWLPIVVSSVIVGLTIWLLRSKRWTLKKS